MPLIDDEQLVAPKPDVDYKNLSEQPSPQDFLVLTRVKGAEEVGKLCKTSGLGREKTLQAIEVLLRVGLLQKVDADGNPIESPAPQPAPPKPEPSPPQPEPIPVAAAPPQPEPEVFAMGSSASSSAAAIDLGAVDDEEEFIVDHQPVAATMRPADVAPEPKAPAQDLGIFGEDRSASQAPQPEAPSSSFNTLAADGEDDDLFMPESPAHLDRVSGKAPIKRDQRAAVASSAARQAAQAATRASAPVEERPAPSPAPTPPPTAEPQAPQAPPARQPAPTSERQPAPTSRAVDISAIDLARYRFFPTAISTYSSEHETVAGFDPTHQLEIDFVYDHLEYLDFYQLFGVDQTATRKEIRTAYFSMSKQFHPDKFFRDDYGDLSERVDAIFRFVTKGYQTLAKKDKRSEYDAALQRARAQAQQASADDERKRAMAADMLERRAAQLEQQGNFSQAATEYKKVGTLRRDPQALVRAASLMLRANERLDEAAGLARTAASQLPGEVGPLVVLGQIYEKNGMLAEAATAFANAQALAPDDPSVRVHLERVRSQG